MAFHFFTEPTKLAIQNANQAYGAIDANQYRLGNMFTAAAGQTPKAFAVTDGLVLVQKIGSTNRYNIVLKPTNQPDLGLPKIDYIIYKGIKQDSLISGGLVASADKNDLTKIIRENAVAWYSAKNPVEEVPYTEPDANRSLGLVYNATATDPDYLKLDSSSLNEVFYATNGITLPSVFSGNHIGDFDNTGDIGIVVVFEKIGFTPTFKLARELDSKLEFTDLGTTPTNVEKFQRKHKKEEILSYMDSSAFFGAFSLSELMVYNGTEFEKKSEDALYSDVIFRHANKNKIYLDIRNDYNDSFNYYENYSNTIRWSLDNTNTLVDINYYRNHNWPLLVINDEDTVSEFDETNTDKTIKFSLASPNDDTLIYYKKVFKNSLAFDVPDDNIFHKPDLINGWLLADDLKVPKSNNRAISNYFQIKTLTNVVSENSASTPAPIGFSISKETYLDNLFPIFDMEIPFDLTSGTSALKIYYDTNFTDKTYINSSNFPVNTGIAKDNNFTSFIAFPHKYNLNIKQNQDDKIPVSGMQGAEGSLFLNELSNQVKSIQLVKSKFTIDSNNIEFLKFVPVNNEILSDDETVIDTGMTTEKFTFDDVIVLSLTNSEYETLKTLKEDTFPADYKVYLGIENIVTDVDDIGNFYTKFEYCLKGLKEDTEGNIVKTSASPSPAIISYTDSKLKGYPYKRNYEEKIGFDNFYDATTKYKYEDYFIDRNLNIKNIVTDFEAELKKRTSYKKIEALVRDKGTALWKAACSYVQSPSGSVDDRPLYWARLKMEVMIKEHSYFLGDLDVNSNVIAGSELDDIIILFEENSRNYKGINFSGAGSAKKILITGFDPFLLNQNHPLYGTGFNIKQSNPSGCVALSLHNSLTQNAIGYIQTMIVPVRYKDFDSSKSSTTGQGEGIIEKYIKPWLDEVDMVITISQAGPGEYHIDKYATATRGGFVDNMNFERVPNSYSIDITGNSELEWIHTTLPNEFIQSPVILSNEFTDKYGTLHNPENVGTDSPISGDQMLSGPGGDYLSNEIFYRVAKLREEWISSQSSTATKATGHFHIEKLQNASVHEDFSGSETQTLINNVKTAINNGITGI